MRAPLLLVVLAVVLVTAAPSAADHGAAHTLTVQVTGQGTVTDDQSEISCPTDCTGNYDETTSSLQLTAQPDTGYQFDTWTNCPTSTTDTTCDIQLSADNFVVGARFITEGTQPPPPPPPPTGPPPTAAQRTLTVTVIGPGSVQSDPAGITCGNDCVENLTTNALVVVTAIPAQGAEFTGWSGDCVGSGVSCAITMSAERSLTATFRQPPPTLRLTAAGASFTSGDGGDLTAAGSDVLLSANRRATMVFDGSDVGLAASTEAVDAVSFLSDGSLLVSTVGAASVRSDYRTSAAGKGASITAAGEDVLRFTFTRTGEQTHGRWSLYFDGSDVGLTTATENVDALATSGSQLLLSTAGAVSVKGASGAGEDVLSFRPTRFGATTRGVWSLYFDGSDVGLSGSSENVIALDVTGKALTLVTSGSFSAAGASGFPGDLLRATCTKLGATTTCKLVTLARLSDLELGAGRPGSIDLP